MLTAEQKAEAEKKLKNISEEFALQEQTKAKIKTSIKTITDAINSIKHDPKKQLEIVRAISNQDLPSKISLLEKTNTALIETQERMKNERQKLNREALNLVEEKARYQKGISEIKNTIVNIQNTLQKSVEEESNKRKQIETDLEKSLDEIRNKIKEFQTETEQFNKENAELQQKIAEIKAKLSGIEETYKAKAEEKDNENKTERDELNEKLKVMEAEVEQATQLSKEFSALEKKNFDNKIALYLKTKKFPEYFSSFQGSADTLNSCKQELLKGVQRINQASETIQRCRKEDEQINNQFLAELRRQKDKEVKIDQIKKEKETVRANIIDLQNKLKEKKAKA